MPTPKLVDSAGEEKHASNYSTTMPAPLFKQMFMHKIMHIIVKGAKGTKLL